MVNMHKDMDELRAYLLNRYFRLNWKLSFSLLMLGILPLHDENCEHQYQSFQKNDLIDIEDYYGAYIVLLMFQICLDCTRQTFQSFSVYHRHLYILVKSFE